jgi:asparagine synthase (glutamine-hydrolysing)
MCGISLLINTRNQPVSNQLIFEMNNKVIHRGPDGEGFHIANNFAMGHRRLSIIDLSEAGKQPMKKGDDWIIFNGMIYNFVELRKELESWGHEFNSLTDTEVLLAACQQWGINAFKKLNGMWAFAWYRAAKKEIILCRDHFGIKPLYYTHSGDFFAAASEIKQFTVLPEFQSTLNKSTAVNFLVNGSLNYGDQTFFEGVQELKGGQYLTYNLISHKSTVQQWYNLPEASVEKEVSMDEAIKNIRNLFEDSVRIRMRSDVAVGSCLSGGIDSTAIVSVLNAKNLCAENFATVTSCYKNKKFDEQVYSDVVTKKTGFTALKVFPDLNNLFDLQHMDKMIYHQDQPFSTASHYSEYEVFRTAYRNNLTVMLDGQGSDEFFCGYDEFFVTYLRELLHSGKINLFLHNIRSKAIHENTSTYSVFKGYCKTAYWYPAILRLKKTVE